MLIPCLSLRLFFPFFPHANPRLWVFVLLSGFSLSLQAQGPPPVSAWRSEVSDAKQPDSVRLAGMANLAKHYFMARQLDSSLYFSRQQYELASQKGHVVFMAQGLRGIGYYYQGINNLTLAKHYLTRSHALIRKSGDKRAVMASLSGLGNIHHYTSQYDTASIYLREGLTLAEELGETGVAANFINSLAEIAKARGKTAEAIDYFNRAMELARKEKDEKGMSIVEFNLGGLSQDAGNIKQAIAHYLSSLAHARRTSDSLSIAAVQIQLGNVYSMLNDFENARSYYTQAMDIFIHENEKKGEASVNQRMGALFEKQAQYAEAEKAYLRSLTLYREIGDPGALSTVNHSLANLYMTQKMPAKAEPLFRDILKFGLEMNLPEHQAGGYSGLGRIRQKEGSHEAAIPLLEKGLKQAKLSGNLTLVRDIAALLSRSYDALGRDGKALEMYKLYLQSRDSLEREENHRAVLRLEYDFAYEKKSLADSLQYANQVAIKNLEIQRQRIGLGAAGLCLLLLVALTAVVIQGKKRSDELLLNILPAETAKELKVNGFAVAREHDQVSVLFTDFVKFTEIAASMDARDLVNEIDQCFQAFDAIVTRHKLEKIKTIGDAYMAASGLPDPAAATAKEAVKAALDMQAFIVQRKAARMRQGLPAFDMRVGIHTGPVVAGIVGIKKFQYDVWGDTVNIAARIETHGEPAKVNISETTYQLVRDEKTFRFESRGAIEVKGRGEIEMHFVQLNNSVQA
jgi:adenylate cyclase